MEQPLMASIRPKVRIVMKNGDEYEGLANRMSSIGLRVNVTQVTPESVGVSHKVKGAPAYIFPWSSVEYVEDLTKE